MEEMMPETTTEQSCFEKAKARGQESFTLVAQDITADIVIEVWADVQRALSQYLRRGYTLTQSLHQIRAHLLPLKQQLEPQVTSKKVDEAYAKAKRMAQFPTRKVAD